MDADEVGADSESVDATPQSEDDQPPASSSTEVPHREKMEGVFGQDFGGVKATTGTPDPMGAAGAQGAARGESIAFAEANPAPSLVAHELTHVVQQRQAGDVTVAASRAYSEPSDAAEVEARGVADHVASGGAGPVGVRAAPSAMVQLDPGAAPQPDPNAIAITLAKTFLSGLRPWMFPVSPRPFIVNRYSSGSATVHPTTHFAAPVEFPTTLSWRLVDEAETQLAEGEAIWPNSGLPSPIPITVPAPGSYSMTVEVVVECVGRRMVSVPIEARTPELASFKELSDDELGQQLADLQGQLAHNQKNPSDRARITRAYEMAELESSARGLSRATDPREESAARIYPDQVSSWVPPENDPAGMRAWIERQIAARGWDGGRDEVRAMINSSKVGATFGQQALARDQLELIESDMSAFRDKFTLATFSTAHDMLTNSAQVIGSVVGQYGLGSLVGVDNAADRVRQDEDALPTEIETLMRLKSKKDDAGGAGAAKQGENRGDLQTIVHQLVERQRKIDELWVRYQGVRKTIAAKEHAGHHRKPEPDFDVIPELHEIDDARGRVGQPPLIGMAFPEPVASVPPEQLANELSASIADAEGGLRSAWAQAEAVHPILIHYRGANGADGHKLHGLNSGDDEATRDILRAVLPKLANIKKARSGVSAEKPHPLKLDNVVGMTMQRLLVPPGSIREAVVHDAVSDAGSAGVEDWIIGAFSVALAVVTFIPSGGTSSLLIAADIAGLALDSYMAVKAAVEHQQMQGMANTDLDRAHALASEEPSLTWLAVNLVSAGISGTAVIHGWRQAVALRRAAEAGTASQAAIREMNELGRSHGFGDVGDKIVEGGPYRAADDMGMGRAVSDEARQAAGHLGGLASEHADDLARRLGTGVEVDPGLKGGQIDIDFDDAGGHVWIIGVRVAPDANVADVVAHQAAIKLMQRYNGRVGEFRKLVDRAGAAIGVKGSFQVGTEQWRAWAEIEKLGQEVAARQAALRGMPADELADQLQSEIYFLEERMAQYDTVLTLPGGEARMTEMVVSSPSLSKARRDATEEGMIMPGAFQREGVGAPITPNGAVAPHLGTAIETTVDEVSRLSHIDGPGAAKEWLQLAKSTDTETLRSAIAARARNVATEATTKLRESYLYRDFAMADPEAAKRVIRSTYHQAAQNYFLKLERAAHDMHPTLLSRITRRGGSAAEKEQLHALESLMDAVGTKPVAGNIPIKSGRSGRFMSVDEMTPEARAMVEGAGMDGISYTRGGEPDFTPFIYRDGDILGDVDIKELTGNRNRDFAAADALAKFPNGRPDDWTWHHHEGTRLILVPEPVHDAARHTGSAALFDAITGTRTYGKSRPATEANDLPWEPLR